MMIQADCPTINCTTTSKYKHNIIKHLKSCYIVNKNKKAVGDNRICSICNKVFAKKSNRDRHITDFHSVPPMCDNGFDEQQFEIPTMVTIPNYQYESDDQVQSHEINIVEDPEPSIFSPATPLPSKNQVDFADELESSTSSEITVLSTTTIDVPSKKSRLETVIRKIVTKSTIPTSSTDASLIT